MHVEFFRHDLGDEEFEAVRKVLETVFLTTADKNVEFEAELASYLGVRDTATLSSCTAALHLSLVALGVGPGDEVITTPMSFVASSNAILMTGATPVFVDVEADTGLIDLDAAEAAFTPATRALLPVHLYGAMVDMRRVADFAGRSGIHVVEDAAHAVDSQRDGVRPGQLSSAACMSFYATKAITSGEGGALATQDAELADRIRQLRNHGMTRGASDRYTKRYEHYEVERLGWKYNMTNFQAALLIPQLRRIEKNRQTRSRICETYAAGFAAAGMPFPSFGADPEGHGHHLFTIWSAPEHRDEMLTRLQDRGVGVAVNFRPIHLTSFYREQFGYREGMYPEAERIGASTISLPLYPSLRDDEVEYVIESVIEVSNEIR